MKAKEAEGTEGTVGEGYGGLGGEKDMEDWAGRRIWRTGRGEGYGGLGSEQEEWRNNNTGKEKSKGCDI